MKIQEYLISDELLTCEKKLLFQLRTRIINVKDNFKHGHVDLGFPLCQTYNDTQQHVLECQSILKDDASSLVDPGMKYSALFGTEVRKQVLLTRFFRANMRIRRTILSKEKSSSSVTKVI